MALRDPLFKDSRPHGLLTPQPGPGVQGQCFSLGDTLSPSPSPGQPHGNAPQPSSCPVHGPLSLCRVCPSRPSMGWDLNLGPVPSGEGQGRALCTVRLLTVPPCWLWGGGADRKADRQGLSRAAGADVKDAVHTCLESSWNRPQTPAWLGVEETSGGLDILVISSGLTFPAGR